MAGTYSPNSYFYVEQKKLVMADPANSAADSFGPQNIINNIATQFRTTSKVRTSSLTKIFAICKGKLLIQPNSDPSDTKVNLILKPTDNFAPLKIKYFVYRGVTMSDLILDNNIVPVNGNDSYQPIIVPKLWQAFKDFYGTVKNADGSQSAIPITLPASEIGYDPNHQLPTDLLEDVFHQISSASNVFFQLPSCEAGDHIGNFYDILGFDIVIDEGDYKVENQQELFKFNLAFAQQDDHILKLTDLQSQTLINIKRYQEYSNRFLDIAAFWGSHINCGNIKFADIDSDNSANSIFLNILSNYQTCNNVYFYIKAENDRSYNYYDSATNGSRSVSGLSDTPESNSTFGWPLLIKQTPVQPPIAPTFTDVQLTLQYCIDSHIDSTTLFAIFDFFCANNYSRIYPRTQSLARINSVPSPSDFNIDDLTPDQLIFPIFQSNFCANFAFIKIKSRFNSPLESYYDNLFPADFITSQKLPATTQGLIHWCNRDKKMLLNLDSIISTCGSLESKMVTELGTDTSTTRRLYMAVLKNNSMHNLEFDKLNVSSITSGAGNPTNNSQYSSNVYGDSDFMVWKSQFLDGGAQISGLNIVHNAGFEKSFSYFQLGITELDYNRLFYDNDVAPAIGSNGLRPTIMPVDAENFYFDLILSTGFTGDVNIKKFQIGIKYEDSNGVLQSTISKQTNNIVYVYTLDGRYFFSSAYSAQQSFSINSPEGIEGFRPNNNFSGEFGFDWMRIDDTSLPGDNNKYSDIMGKLYTNSQHTQVQTDGNEYTGFFLVIPSIFQKLELKYKPQYYQVSANIYSKYYVPILTLFPPYISGGIDLDRQQVFKAPFNDDMNRVANLKLRYKVNLQPEKVELLYDKTLLNIVYNTLPITTGSHSIDITVNCLNEFSIEQQIKLVFYYKNTIDGNVYPQTVGLLRIRANNKSSRKSGKIVIILVSTNIGNGSASPDPSVIQAKSLQLKQFLRQVLITPVIEVPSLDSGPTLDLSKDKTFNDNYVRTATVDDPTARVVVNNKKVPITPENNLQDYLYTKLKQEKINNVAIGNKYDSYFRLFCFDEYGGYFDSAGKFILLKGSSLLNSIILFTDAEAVTPTHEFLHSLQIPHSFCAPEADPGYHSANALFTYKPLFTDNIMDYTSTRNTLWDWQGVIARSSADPEP